jgi:hypothetical protein
MSALLGAALAAGCAVTAPPPAPIEVPVYPPPPEPPRFVYERSIYSSADVVREARRDEFRRLVTGEVRVGEGMSKPYAAAVQKGRVYVSDTVRRSVLLFDFSRGVFQEIGTQEPGSLRLPLGLDLDGDGNADVISSSAHKFGIWSYRQRAGGEFLKVDLFPELVSETHALLCLDLDGDGLKDLITGKRFWSHGYSEPGSRGPAMLYWFQARKSPDGMISFTPFPIDDDSGVGTQFTATDVNGDGKLDIVVSNKKGVFVHLQQ